MLRKCIVRFDLLTSTTRALYYHLLTRTIPRFLRYLVQQLASDKGGAEVAGSTEEGRVLKKLSPNDPKRVMQEMLGTVGRVCANIPNHAAMNKEMQAFYRSLDPMFSFPRRETGLKYLHVLHDTLINEFRQIILERAAILKSGFVSLASDFWTDGTRKDCFGACTATVIAKKYPLRTGQDVFVSDKTISNLTPVQKKTFVSLIPTLGILDYPVQFESFGVKHKGAVNLAEWMWGSAVNA